MALDIQVDHPVPLLGALVRDPAQEHGPGVVDDRVRRPEPLLGLAHRVQERVPVGDVDLAAHGFGQGELLELLQPPGEEQQRVSPGGQEAGGGRADAGAGAGDDDQGLGQGDPSSGGCGRGL
nr:hypothetical protein [Streptomyces lavendulae]